MRMEPRTTEKNVSLRILIPLVTIETIFVGISVNRFLPHCTNLK